MSCDSTTALVLDYCGQTKQSLALECETPKRLAPIVTVILDLEFFIKKEMFDITYLPLAVHKLASKTAMTINNLLQLVE
jgi:hypothetical protein